MSMEKVREIIADIMGCDLAAVEASASLKEDIGLDSLDAMEVSLRLEEEYGLKIEGDDLKRFVTVKDIADFVDQHRA